MRWRTFLSATGLAVGLYLLGSSAYAQTQLPAADELFVTHCVPHMVDPKSHHTQFRNGLRAYEFTKTSPQRARSILRRAGHLYKLKSPDARRIEIGISDLTCVLYGRDVNGTVLEPQLVDRLTALLGPMTKKDLTKSGHVQHLYRSPKDAEGLCTLYLVQPDDDSLKITGLRKKC